VWGDLKSYFLHNLSGILSDPAKGIFVDRIVKKNYIDPIHHGSNFLNDEEKAISLVYFNNLISLLSIRVRPTQDDRDRI
jgi:hypothetical protein